jgi:hypothetical protein
LTVDTERASKPQEVGRAEASFFIVESLLHPGAAFPVLVVLPFTLIAVVSAALFSRLNPHSPKYPVTYGTKPRAAW